MYIVSTGVHDTFTLRAIFPSWHLRNGQRVHIRAERNDTIGGLPTLDHSYHTSVCHRLIGYAHHVELLLSARGSLRLLQRYVGMAAPMATPPAGRRTRLGS